MGTIALIAWIVVLLFSFCLMWYLEKSKVALLVVVFLGILNTCGLGLSVVHANAVARWQDAGPAQVGWLSLCQQFCDNPWSDCYRAYLGPSINTNPSETSKLAIAFFRSNVYGDGVHNVSLNQFPIHSPGRPTLLMTFGGNASKLAQVSGWSVMSLDWIEPMGNASALLNAVATLAKTQYQQIVAFGSSRVGKVVYWAAAIAPPGLYDDVLIDSGGSLGPASAKLVGPCGETFAAMKSRWPQWLHANVSQLSAPRDWPFDVGDVMLTACHTTRYHISVSRHDQWNNWAGTMLTVENARAAGCKVRVVEGYNAHGGYFFP